MITCLVQHETLRILYPFFTLAANTCLTTLAKAWGSQIKLARTTAVYGHETIMQMPTLKAQIRCAYHIKAKLQESKRGVLRGIRSRSVEHVFVQGIKVPYRWGNVHTMLYARINKKIYATQ